MKTKTNIFTRPLYILISAISAIIVVEAAAQKSKNSETHEADDKNTYTQAMLSGAVMYSIEKKDKALLESALHSGFDPNKSFYLPEKAGGEQNGNLALHLACALNNDEAVGILLKHKADSRIRNQLGELAIHCANEPL